MSNGAPADGFRDDLGYWLAKDFETFALDHKIHPHCSVCRGCILDARTAVLTSAPLYCVGCRDKIAAALPPNSAPPWEWTVCRSI